MSESVLVIGAGIGGLCAALSLSGEQRHITILERDDAPPGDDPDLVFLDWHRRGAGHVRQSHAFLARLREIIRKSHPGLLDILKEKGARDLTFDMMLTDSQLESYEPQPGDRELTIVTSRRTTLELAMREYVEGLTNVTIRSGVFVRRLLTEPLSNGAVKIKGVCINAEEHSEDLFADVIVDASGKSGFLIDQLRESGATIEEESETAGILYFTRHYKLLPGLEEPSRNENPPGTGDLGYLKYGVFPGDNGCFSITISVPEIELELRKAVMNPDTFHALTLQLPGLQPWTNSKQSEPRGKVYGMGDLHSRWRSLVVDGKPSVENYFPLGDTLIRTNPLYGRGCSFAAVSAQLLGDLLVKTDDPAERQKLYHSGLKKELRPFYLTQRAQDRAAIKRARNTLTPGYKKSLRGRLLESFFEDGVRIAVRSDVQLMREAMRGFHMLEHPNKWLVRPRNLVKVLYYWFRGKRRNAAAYPPSPGPDRNEMLIRLSINYTADMDRLASEGPLAA